MPRSVEPLSSACMDYSAARISISPSSPKIEMLSGKSRSKRSYGQALTEAKLGSWKMRKVTRLLNGFTLLCTTLFEPKPQCPRSKSLNRKHAMAKRGCSFAPKNLVKERASFRRQNIGLRLARTLGEMGSGVTKAL